MTEMIQKNEASAIPDSPEAVGADKRSGDEGGDETTDRPTLRTSQGTQVRGYLESILDADFVRELRKALGHAHRLTGDDWRVEIRAGDVEIVCHEDMDEVEISLDSVLELASDSVKESCEEQPESGPARIKLPAPRRPKSSQSSKKNPNK